MQASRQHKEGGGGGCSISVVHVCHVHSGQWCMLGSPPQLQQSSASSLGPHLSLITLTVLRPLALASWMTACTRSRRGHTR
jgi:hypothetical protein